MGELTLIKPVTNPSKESINPLMLPVVTSSEYGKRTDPKTGEKEVRHGGIDYVAEVGIRVMASESGKVVKAGFNGSKSEPKLGNVIIIDHTPGAEKNERHFYTVYGHLRDGNPFAVKAGDTVERGQVIGYSGNTGKSTNPHLHFGVAYVSGKQGMPSGDGKTWIATSEYSDPNNYIGHTYKLEGTLPDMVESAIMDRVEFVPDIDLERKDPFRMQAWLDGKYLGYVNKHNGSIEANIEYDFKEELSRVWRKPLRVHESRPIELEYTIEFQ